MKYDIMPLESIKTQLILLTTQAASAETTTVPQVEISMSVLVYQVATPDML